MDELLQRQDGVGFAVGLAHGTRGHGRIEDAKVGVAGRDGHGGLALAFDDRVEEELGREERADLPVEIVDGALPVRTEAAGAYGSAREGVGKKGESHVSRRGRARVRDVRPLKPARAPRR